MQNDSKLFQLNVPADNVLNGKPDLFIDIKAVRYSPTLILVDFCNLNAYKVVMVKSWEQVFNDAKATAKKMFADAENDELHLMDDDLENEARDLKMETMGRVIVHDSYAINHAVSSY